MIKENFKKINDYLWEIPKDFRKDMLVPARVYASDKIWPSIEEGALEQLVNTTTLPGIMKYALAMPDIHQGYGPPIGGVGAFKLPDGAISPSFVGFDLNCGVRILKSEYKESELKPYVDKLAAEMQKQVPSGLGKGRHSKLSVQEINKILEGGVPYLIQQGNGKKEDIENCEENGKMKQADISAVSDYAKNRGRDQVGTLGSGNHFISLEKVEEIFDEGIAKKFGLFKNQVVIMIHSGSRGLGHQICTDYLRIIMHALDKYKIKPVDRELVYVPFNSPEGQKYFKAMSAACNFAWANRHTISVYIRKAWNNILGDSKELKLLYDIAHNIAKIEEYEIDNKKTELLVHRKGATRAFPGQIVIVPGSMGDPSYIMIGTEQAKESWYSVCHGAGRVMSRRQAIKNLSGEKIVEELRKQGIIIKCRSWKGISEEAPQVYKNIDDVVEVVHQAGLSKKVVKLQPIAVIKGE